MELSLVPRRFPRLLARDRRCRHARLICMAREVVGLRSMVLVHARVIRHTGDLSTKHRSVRPTSRTILPSVSECLFFYVPRVTKEETGTRGRCCVWHAKVSGYFEVVAIDVGGTRMFLWHAIEMVGTRSMSLL